MLYIKVMLHNNVCKGTALSGAVITFCVELHVT